MIINACPIAARGQQVIYVNTSLASGANDGSSWANAFQGSLGLQTALTGAAGGTQIWVAAGRYVPAGPNGDRTISISLKSGVSIYGGFNGTETSLEQRNPALNVTILSGDLNGNDVGGSNTADNSYHVVRGSGVDTTGIVDDFTIRDGRAPGGGALNQGWGANLLVESGAPVFRNCIFTLGNASSAGGGAALNAASPTFENCRFVANKAQSNGGGLINWNGGSPTLRGCVFQANIGGGGAGIYAGPYFVNGQLGGLITLSDCDFIDNEGQVGFAPGPGMFIDRNPVQARRCRFIHNTTDASGGGAHIVNSPSTFVNCDFVANEAPGDGGGGLYITGQPGAPLQTPVFANCRFVGNNGAIFNHSGSVDMINCTMANNSFGFGQFLSWPVVDNGGPSLRLRNCLIWGNQPVGGTGLSGILVGSPGITIDNCDIQSWDGSRPGVNTFAADPRFVNAAGADGQIGTIDDDVHLLAGSPCIDHGNEAFLPADVTDLDADGDIAEQLPQDFDSQRRITGCHVDIGYDELFPGPLGTGDANGDGVLNLDDISAFTDDLLNNNYDCAADMNGDQVDDGLDVAAFVSLLIHA